MNKVNAFLKGCMINLSVNGKLEVKMCKSHEDAKAHYMFILDVINDPTDENIKRLYLSLNDKTRSIILTGLECDIFNGKVYLEGFNTPIPQEIVDIVQEYHDNGFSYEPIINFWKLLMINPDPEVRESLFGFLNKFNFVLTQHGYFLAYKAVARYTPTVVDKSNPLDKFVKESFDKIKNKWKKSPKNFVVYVIDATEDKYGLTESDVISVKKVTDKGYGVVDNLDKLYNNLSDAEVVEDYTHRYTDKHTRKMDIRLGVPCKQERRECDSNAANECSNGLHVGTTKYVESFAGNDDVILSCLVNPAHVIAIPNYDRSKMRVCEYFPLDIVETLDRKIVNHPQAFFESDYIAYEKEELEKMADAVRKNQLPLEPTKNTLPDDREMSELLKIIESRLIDINE